MPKVKVHNNKVVEPVGRLAEQQARAAEEAVKIMNSEIGGVPDSPRKVAPAAKLVNDLFKDERAELVELAKERMREKDGEDEVQKWHWCYRRDLEKEPLHIKEMLGYVIERGKGNKPITHKLDILCRMSKEEFQKGKDKSGLLARIQLEEAERGSKAEYGATDREGRTHGLVQME